ncbi:hypothetical protein HaLaN_15329, partial [Haematococcus lacustris]
MESGSADAISQVGRGQQVLTGSNWHR